jgi:hypothetical protein
VHSLCKMELGGLFEAEFEFEINDIEGVRLKMK